MAELHGEPWDRDFSFDDVFEAGPHRSAVGQKPQDGTAMTSTEDLLADRARAGATSLISVVGREDATTDLRKTILGLENAKLL